MKSLSTWILSIKILLISTGLVSIAMFIKFSFPLVTQFVCYQVPIIWYFIVSLLRPPYLYFVINGIIFVIAVSSRTQNREEEDEVSESQPLVTRSDQVLVYEDVVLPEVVKSVVVYGAEVAQREEEVVVLKPQRSKSMERLPEVVIPEPEKPLVSTRVIRAPKTSSQGGGAMRPVAQSNENENETLENTWKAITQSRQVSSNKCDTRENQNRPLKSSIQSNPSMKKSATFRDRTNYNSPINSSPSPRKEPSLSENDLNRRVEAFIKKFNDEMRLQRQESLMKRSAR